MYVNFDPEGNVSGIFPDSPVSLMIPAGYSVHLYASFDSAWEQAVVIYIDNEKYDQQLGSYVLRSKALTIPKRETAFELTLVGWHKRSDANPDLPWVASRGQRVGPVVFAWDDSAEDGDYRDTRVKLVTS
jgi:hypothetical protein